MPFLHKKLKKLRISAGLTQTEAAAKAGLSKGSYIDLEYGRYPGPSLTSIEKVAEAFGVDVCELIGKLRASPRDR